MNLIAEKALKRIARKIKTMFSENVTLIVAFGSRVRGDHNAESDLDVLVVVKHKTLETEKKIMDIFFEEEIKSGITFHPVIKSQEIFEKERKTNTPFYQSIQKEGLKL